MSACDPEKRGVEMYGSRPGNDHARSSRPTVIDEDAVKKIDLRLRHDSQFES